MRKEIKRFTLLDFYKDPTLMRKIHRKDWKSLGVKGATHIEKDSITGDMIFVKITGKR